MPDWSDALCSALDSIETNLASACGLRRGLTGEEFEEALGLLLRWRQVRHLEDRFASLGGPTAGSVYGDQQSARTNTGQRLDSAVRVINTTLYDQFGQHRINDGSARKAYGALVEELGVERLLVATTNYDRAVEAALSHLGRKVSTGFDASPGRTPRLDVAGLVEGAGEDMTPVLHLHGAVGWYEREGAVFDHNADQPFNETLGTPVVLYPDPEKDPTNDATVNSLWTEFDLGLRGADHVLVLGHSLHDPALIRVLRAAKPRKLAVTIFDDEDRGRVQKILPGSIAMKMDFGPDLDVERSAVAAFRG
jgi:hypothetical protein